MMQASCGWWHRTVTQGCGRLLVRPGGPSYVPLVAFAHLDGALSVDDVEADVILKNRMEGEEKVGACSQPPATSRCTSMFFWCPDLTLTSVFWTFLFATLMSFLLEALALAVAVAALPPWAHAVFEPHWLVHCWSQFFFLQSHCVLGGEGEGH